MRATCRAAGKLAHSDATCEDIRLERDAWNGNQFISMMLRMIPRLVMRGGINVGLDAVGIPKGSGITHGPDDMWTVQTGHQAMRLGRKIGRF